jgi:hypothetical protein
MLGSGDTKPTVSGASGGLCYWCRSAGTQLPSNTCQASIHLRDRRLAVVRAALDPPTHP